MAASLGLCLELAGDSSCKSNNSSSMSRTDSICPCCRRSLRGEVNETGKNVTMCSQQQPTSCRDHGSCSDTSLSPNTHLCSYPLTSFRNSQFRKGSVSGLTVSSSSSAAVRYSKSAICKCAKNQSSRSASSGCSIFSADHHWSPNGWRAARLVLVGVLIILLPASTMSSPVNHRSQSRSPSPHTSGHRSHHSSPHRGNDKPMKWINPCRIPKSMPTQPSEIQMPTQTDEEIFQNIVTQAKKAEVQARQFFEDFREECFGKTGHDFPQLHYNWLKDVAEKVGKDLGEPVGQPRLDTLEVEDILKSMYRGLQKLAVGLEQVVLDQAFHGGSFYQHFHEAEFQLKYVLCEFQIAMMEKNIQYEDVTRDIMDLDFRNLEERTLRNLRDFSIFRDYLNTLEFIKESFEHFWKQAKQSS